MSQNVTEYDVFCSYSSRDHVAVKAVSEWLIHNGVSCFIDRDYLISGTPWPQALEQALEKSPSVAVFLGPGPIGRWQQREVFLALDRQASRQIPVIPILLPGSDPPLGFLSLNTWIDLRDGINDERQLRALQDAIKGKVGALDERQTVTQSICPFRGLLPFREEDAAYFYGRKAYSAQLVQAVRRHSFVAVLGASGSGKSSIVYAGLVPQLRRDTDDGAWEFVGMVPTDRPLRSLAESLLPLLEADMLEVERLREVNALAESLTDGRVSFRDVVDRILTKQQGTDRILLVVDQWEELYTLCRNSKEIRTFIDHLLEAADHEVVNIVCTCRGDFYGRVLEHRPMVDRIQNAQISLGPMTEQELQEVIEKPPQHVGLSYEAGLVQRILADVGNEPGRLPLLSFLLQELWESRCDNLVSNELYDEIGGVDGAIARKAESVFANLSVDEQQHLPRIFIQLVSVGEGSEDTRRRASIATLERDARPIINKLASARLLVTSPDASRPEETVEVAHEALIRNWGRLQQWVEASRAFLVWRKRLEPFLAEWARDKSSTLQGDRLVEAQAWLVDRGRDLDEPEHQFIEASLRRARADRRRRKVTWSVVVILLTTVVGFAAVSFIQIRRGMEQDLAAVRAIGEIKFTQDLDAIDIERIRIALRYPDAPAISSELNRLEQSLTLATDLRSIRSRHFTLIKSRESQYETPGVRYLEDFATIVADYEVLMEKRLEFTKATDDELLVKVKASRVTEWIVAGFDDWAFACHRQSTWISDSQEKQMLYQTRDRLLRISNELDPGLPKNKVRDVKNWESAESLADLANQASSELSASLRDVLANLMMLNGADAETMLRDELARRPNDFWCNYQLGYVLARKEEKESGRNANIERESLRYLQAAHALRPRETSVYVALASASTIGENHDYQAAEKYLKRAIDAGETNPSVYNMLGFILREQDKIEAAISQFSKAINQSDSKNTMALINLADLLADKDTLEESGISEIYDLDEAIRLFNKAIEIDPNDASIRYRYGGMLQDHNLLGQSEKQYREALEIPSYSWPQKSWIHNNLANTLALQGKLEEAVEQFELAIKDDPENLWPYVNRGLITEKLGGDLKTVKQLYAKALSFPADKPWKEIVHAEARENLERIDPVLRSYDVLAQQFDYEPTTALESLAFAEANYRHGRYAEATRLYVAAFQRDSMSLKSPNGFYAACSASRAAAMSEEEHQQEEFHTFALQWLRGELSSLRTKAEEDDLQVAAELNWWKRTPDLASVRDLPEENWLAFWEHVDDLRQISKTALP